VELGPGNSRAVVGAPDAGQVPLTVLDAGAAAGFKIQNLAVRRAVGRRREQRRRDRDHGADGRLGLLGFRLFYGTPENMVERPITAYNQAISGPADISFSVGSANYVLHTTFVFGPDSGPLGSPEPAKLDIGGGVTLSATLVMPAPTSLSGFTFNCW
jgi:hypothetical protein